MTFQFVRVGVLGHVGRFTSADGTCYSRGRRVICRTGRGLEVGEVLGSTHHSSEIQGAILRRVTPEDDLLLARLEKNKREAVTACESLLASRRIEATLMDVEHLFDGQSLFFYFIGEMTSEIESVTRELADAYDARVQFRQFADAVTRGCGPDCGTEAAAGCGDSCASCAIAGACSTR